jgi:hypothetical protein
MTKLSDLQRLVLSKAAGRDDGGAVVSAKMNKATTTKLAASLAARKLMREVRSKPGMPVWREDSEGRSVSLVITRAGRAALGVAGKASVSDRPLSVAKGKAERTPERQKNTRNVSMLAARGDAALDDDGAGVAISPPRSSSKQALVIGMLTKKDGASLDALVAATGWLPHSARAALTGLRKRGFAIERQRPEGDAASVYRIVANAKSAA